MCAGGDCAVAPSERVPLLRGSEASGKRCQFLVAVVEHLKRPGFCLLSPEVLSGDVYLLCGSLLAFLSAQLAVLYVIHLLHPVNPGREFSRTETCLSVCMVLLKGNFAYVGGYSSLCHFTDAYGAKVHRSVKTGFCYGPEANLGSSVKEKCFVSSDLLPFFSFS